MFYSCESAWLPSLMFLCKPQPHFHFWKLSVCVLGENENGTTAWGKQRSSSQSQSMDPASTSLSPVVAALYSCVILVIVPSW